MVTDITIVASRWNVPGGCGGERGGVATPVQAQAEGPSRSEGEVFSSHAHTPRLPKPYASAPCVCLCLAGMTPAGGRAVRRGSTLSPCCAAPEFLPVIAPPGSPAQTLPSSLPASVNPLPSLLPASPALAPSLGTKKPLHQHTSGIFRPSPAPRGPNLTSCGRKLTYWSGGATRSPFGAPGAGATPAAPRGQTGSEDHAAHTCTPRIARLHTHGVSICPVEVGNRENFSSFLSHLGLL